MSASDDTAVFRFEGPGIQVEFDGPEAFVEAQIALLKDRVSRELAAALERGTRGGDAAPRAAEKANADAATTPTASAPSVPTLAEFYERAHSRKGRGALQETILIFAYYLRDMRAQAMFSIPELSSCFATVGVPEPSSLANTLGIMKRSQGFFESGAGRGRYVLSDKGAAYVRRLIGAQ